MIKLMIVGGNITVPLVDYLGKRGGGSLETSVSYASLSGSAREIEGSIIKVDKLVYVMKDEMNIKQDMATLKKLMSDNSFFQVKEIFIFTVESDTTLRGIEFFKSVMADVNFMSYHVNCVKDTLSYPFIYDELLGIVDEDAIKNTYKKVYRQEISSDSKQAYEGEDNGDLVIEPFSYKNINTFEKVKQFAVSSETGIPQVEGAEKIVNTESNLSIGRISLEDTYKRGYVNIVTGLNKSGVSTRMCALTLANIKSNRKVLVIDLSSTKTSYDILKETVGHKVSVSQIPLKNLVGTKIKVFDDNCIVLKGSDLGYGKMDNVICLTYFLSVIKNISPDVVFIDCPIDSLEDAVKLVGNITGNLFITSGISKPDMDVVQKKLSYLEDNVTYKSIKKFAFTNTSVKNSKYIKILTPMQYKSAFKDFTVLKHTDLEVLNVDKDFYDNIIGG